MKKINKMRWEEFTQQALSASLLAEYKYCPSKAVLAMRVEEQKTREMSEGKFIHEKEAREILDLLGPMRSVPSPETVEDALVFSRKQLDKALKERVILANTEDSTMFFAIVPELGIWGKPDHADCTDGKRPLVVETKTTYQLPYKVWDDARVQVGVYMLGLEALGFECKYGLLRYKLRRDVEQVREFEVFLDDEMRRLVEDTVHSIRNVLEGSVEATAADTQGKCVNCRKSHSLIYEMCKQKLI